MSFFPCPRCATPMLSAHRACPHCHTALSGDEEIRVLPALLSALLLSGCGDKDDTEDTADTASVQAEYGVAETDRFDDEEE